MSVCSSSSPQSVISTSSPAMLQILLFLSAQISNFGESIYQFAHGVFALSLFDQACDFRSTPTLPAGPSLLVDSPVMFPGPSQSWSPRFSDGRFATDNGPDPSIAQGFSRASDMLGIEVAMFLKLLVSLTVLSVISMLFVRDPGGLFNVPLSWAHSAPARFLASVHAMCTTKMSHKNEELAKELDSALQQIKHGSIRIQSLSAENRALISLAIGQGVDVRTQSDLINQLEGQLRDQGHALEQAVSYQGQYERNAFTNSQEVARLEERMAALTVESDMAQSASLLNRRHAQAREERLGSALHTIEILLSETQMALRLSQESSLRQHDSLSFELETCAKQRDHWKAAAEQFESKVLESERNMLNLRKELAIAYRSTREAKEQLETQTVVLGEREATIRSLGRELADVRDQVQNAKYEIEGLREDLESVDAWKPSDSADGFGLTDELPPILEWRGWMIEGTPDAPVMFAFPTQSQPRHSPGMSIEDFISAISSPSSQATPAPSNEILLCSTTHVIRSTELDDHFVVDYLPQPQPCTQPSRSSNTPRDVMASFATSQSYLNYMETVDELREQLADEQLNRAHIEDEVTLLQLKVLATEAVIVVQRRQLSSQQFQLFEETTKNASLCDESRSLMVERDAMAARIAVLEAGLVECRAEEMAATKAADEAHAELAQAKEVLCACVNEVDAVHMERDKLDMRLSQAILLSSALQERVVALEQRIASAVITPSDDPHEGDCSLEFVVSRSIPYLLDMSLPSLSSWGSVCHSLSNPNLQPAITVSKSGPRLCDSPMPGWSWSKLPISPTPGGRIFDGLVASETSLSLLLASTPPEALPEIPPASPTPSSTRSDASSPCPLTRYPRPEDISPMPTLGRIGKRRSPPPRSRPYRPIGGRIPVPR